MKVYIGYECMCNFSGEYWNAVKVFADETNALIWTEEFEAYESCGDSFWRYYKEFDVE